MFHFTLIKSTSWYYCKNHRIKYSMYKNDKEKHVIYYA